MGEIFGGRYEVLEKLREGGMGAIFKVRRLPDGQTCVVKTTKRDSAADERSRRRLQAEARVAISLRHPNIVAVFDFFEPGDGSFGIVMEYIDGPTLAERGVGAQRLPVPEVLDISLQVLDALRLMHGRGVIHRDLSPENVMFQSQPDGSSLVKVIDLGIARDTTGGAEAPTQTGAFVGKIRYCSPEQLGALGPSERIDGRSDLYSFGCVLYQMLTGELPVRADAIPGYILGHVSLPPRSFDETDPEGRVPGPLREAVLKAIAKRREDRWATAEEFAWALYHVRESYRTGELSEPAARDVPAKSSRRLVPAAALGVGAVLLLALLSFIFRDRLPGLGGPSAPGTLVVTAAPWARVARIHGPSGKEIPLPAQELESPARLVLAPGSYRLVLRGRVGGAEVESELSAEVSSGRETRAHALLPGFDVERIVGTYAP